MSMKGIKLLIMDVDGTLTDGKINIGENGELFKAFSVKDGHGINRILPEIGIEPVIVPVRGGTDGAQLTFRGLPCPNIATGAYNFHSVREFVPVNALEVTVDLLEHLVAKFA